MKEALQRLDQEGHVAYVVGGSVRDFLLGRETKDHDIATSAGPDELCRIFPEAITVGKAFGVIKVPIEGQEFPLEIATFREDLEYRDHRHPTGVLFAGPSEDARRRDFSINALFFDPKTSRILDTVGGMEDLQAGVIRAIGDPSARFQEDALRLLRAVRFATALGFEIEPETAQAIAARAKLISKVSNERIRDELTAMLLGPRPVAAVKLLSEFGLLKRILPEVEAMRGVRQIPDWDDKAGDVWNHSLRVLDQLAKQNPKRSFALAWAALLHDVGKPVASMKSGGKNFNSHEIYGSNLVKSIGDRLKMPRAEILRIAAMVEDHLKFKDVFQMRESTLQRFVREPHFEELLALHRADAMASDGNLAAYEFCSTRYQEYKNTPQDGDQRLITGEDLIQMGFKPGPSFSEILRTVEDLALERKLTTKDEALEYVVKHFVI